MAGLPLKSGADFYNLEAARMRLHNLGADPTEVGAGLIYFNTSTGLNTSQKARLYTGSAWKTIAFSEDLDVASNADFLALKDKVDTLIGDGVDMDGIIESWKEVEAFLSGMSDTKSLMDLLNGKLNTSGGTINGNLLIGAPDNTSYRYLQFARSGYGSRINIADGDLYVSFGGIDANGGLTATKVFSLGNNGIRYASDGKTYHDILTSAGGTIKSDSGYMLTLNRLSESPTLIAFQSRGALKGFLGIDTEGKPVYLNTYAVSYTLLHEGNVGEYNAGSANILASSYNENINYESYTTHLKLIKSTSGDYVANGFPAQYVSGLSVMSGYTGWQMVTYGDPASDMRPYFRAVGGEGNWQAWKQLAFTDSNVASATKLENPRTIWGQSFDGTADVSGALHLGTGTIRSSKSGTDLVFLDFGSQGDPYIGYGMAGAGIDSHLCGNTIYLHYGTSRANGLILNSSGNVTIGASDLAGSTYKLVADGNIKAKEKIVFSPADKYFGELSMSTSCLQLSAIQEGFAYLPIALNPNGGNVLIGTTIDNGAKLQVNGVGSMKYLLFTNAANNGTAGYIGRGSSTDNIYIQTDGANDLIFRTENKERMRINATGDVRIKGNLIVDGEVSAGGAAEEGGNAGGGGAFHSDIIKEGATQTTIAHGLGTDDIVVSIYEKDGVSGRWSIILTDVEIVDANNIIVSFGSATTVEHKVVIMGAVA